jgi:hypothetical protein
MSPFLRALAVVVASPVLLLLHLSDAWRRRTYRKRYCH